MLSLHSKLNTFAVKSIEPPAAASGRNSKANANIDKNHHQIATSPHHLKPTQLLASDPDPDPDSYRDRTGHRE